MPTMLAAQFMDKAHPPEIVVIPTPAEPERWSSVIQLRVLATGLHQILRARSRINGEYFTSSSDIPGVDGVGETSYGERFFFLKDGSFAEYVNVPMKECFPLPPGLNPIKAASLVYPALTSWLALTERCENLPRDFSVLVMGVTSPCGRLTIPLARAIGAKRVIGCARDEGVLKTLDLDDYIILQAKSEFTDFSKLGHIDVIVDYLYGPATTNLLKTLRPGGKVQYVHVGCEKSEISLPESVLTRNDLTIRGSAQGAWDEQTIGRGICGVIQALLTVDNEEIIVKSLGNVETAWNKTENWIVLIP
ncbi:MAG: hypothetical protein LQ343_005782 [Gyalolechia ehrenbergii]|nr:MAG: hypothetical protein LQ343_005782 [Gyalolechia ehrenbergii]